MEGREGMMISPFLSAFGAIRAVFSFVFFSFDL
jgi:hypothetical protein